MRSSFAVGAGLALALAAAPGLATATPGTPVNNQQAITQVIQRALSQQGVPYVYGGGGVSGPTNGVRPDAATTPGLTPYPGSTVIPGAGVIPAAPVPTTVGFDSSGLIQYAYAAAGIKMPRTSGEQCNVGRKVLAAQALPGDLMCFGPGGSQSVAMYLGNGQMIEGTEPGVTVSPARTSNMVPYLTRIIEA